MTPREANADLLAEITALRDRVASLTDENAELQGALAQASHREGATSEILRVISQPLTPFVYPDFTQELNRDSGEPPNGCIQLNPATACGGRPAQPGSGA
jgi:hypothetical protein